MQKPRCARAVSALLASAGMLMIGCGEDPLGASSRDASVDAGADAPARDSSTGPSDAGPREAGTADGSVEVAVHAVRACQTRTYDATGKLIYRVITYVDARGRLVRQEEDEGDCVIVRSTSYAFDEVTGKLAQMAYDHTTTGTLAEERWRYSYDNGRLSTAELLTRAGILRLRQTFVYDLSCLIERRHELPDGSSGGRLVFRNGPRCELLMMEVQTPENIPIQRAALHYNDPLNPVSATEVDSDWDADGVIDQRELFTYHAEGDLLVHAKDTTASGVIDDVWSYTYDSNHARSSGRHTNRDGIVDKTQEYRARCVTIEPPPEGTTRGLACTPD